MDGGGARHDAKFEVGKAITVDLNDGSSLRAFVHAEDASSTLVCLEVIPSGDVVLISTANVKCVTPIRDPRLTRTWPPHPTVDVAKIRAEEDRVFRRQHAEFAQVGVGVSQGAQAIFDSLAKTLPCKWERETIVILDTVRLAPPYNAAAISGDGDAGVVSRVRMILEREASGIKNVDPNGVST